MQVDAYLLQLTLCIFLREVHSHGRLIEPPSRASAWRYGFNTPHNYNDHELYCGGFTRQWVKNEGKCGICGDAWDVKIPRPHEYGGTYGKGLIVRKYAAGSTVTLRVELTANHNGYFEFSVCPNYKNPSQHCLSENLLKLVNPQDDVDHLSYRYFPKNGNKVYEMKYRIPKKSCEHCILQWRYIAGNNWGNCPNGTGAVGCGPQEEFRACADIAILAKGAEEELTPPAEEPTIPTAPGVPTVPTPEGTYSQLSTLIISLVSFLVVFLTFFLLYFHFYQIGGQIKTWLGKSKDEELSKVPLGYKGAPPQPPPRTKRTKSFSEPGDCRDSIA